MKNERGQGLAVVWLIFGAFIIGFVLATLIAKGIIPLGFLNNWMCP